MIQEVFNYVIHDWEFVEKNISFIKISLGNGSSLSLRFINPVRNELSLKKICILIFRSEFHEICKITLITVCVYELNFFPV